MLDVEGGVLGVELLDEQLESVAPPAQVVVADLQLVHLPPVLLTLCL